MCTKTDHLFQQGDEVNWQDTTYRGAGSGIVDKTIEGPLDHHLRYYILTSGIAIWGCDLQRPIPTSHDNW